MPCYGLHRPFVAIDYEDIMKMSGSCSGQEQIRVVLLGHVHFQFPFSSLSLSLLLSVCPFASIITLVITVLHLQQEVHTIVPPERQLR